MFRIKELPRSIQGGYLEEWRHRSNLSTIRCSSVRSAKVPRPGNLPARTTAVNVGSVCLKWTSIILGSKTVLGTAIWSTLCSFAAKQVLPQSIFLCWCALASTSCFSAPTRNSKWKSHRYVFVMWVWPKKEIKKMFKTETFVRKQEDSDPDKKMFSIE